MYLGPPKTMGRNQNAIMGFITDRPQKRINGWDNKLLLRVVEVLLKMVTQGMPIYAMSVFMLTDELHNEKEKKKDEQVLVDLELKGRETNLVDEVGEVERSLENGRAEIP